MTYPSEPFTRSVILFVVKYFNRKSEIENKIDRAKSSSAINSERTYYFWYGGLLFSIIGVFLIFLSIGATFIALFSDWINFGWIGFVFPGWFFFGISIEFRNLERKSIEKISYPLEYSKWLLLKSSVCALLVAFAMVGSLLITIS